MRKSYIFFLALYLVSCIDPFNAPDLFNENTLVVEGFLSTNLQQHEVTLSRLSPINVRKIIPEKGAIVWIQSNNGETIKLSESGSGVYLTPAVAGAPGVGYTLFFNTSNGRKYSSQEVILKEVPPIDSVYGKFVSNAVTGDNGIQISLDTKGSIRQGRYYRWKYFETFEIHTPRESLFVWSGGNQVDNRVVPINVCWRTDTLKNILTKSTSGLSENEVVGLPLRYISSSSYELQVKYRIQVRQYALTQSGYEYWNYLKLLNESQGSLYDIQPGSVQGNISSISDKSELVLGYFDASQISEKIVYFTPDKFRDAGFKSARYKANCDNIQPEVVPIQRIGAYFEYNGTQNTIISDAIGLLPNVTLVIYPRICCDCTLTGTNSKPPFWQ